MAELSQVARRVKVSVCVITYNHEKYLAQALESALNQEVDFEYEIVVGEDCSTDATRGILVDFQKRHPKKIRALLPESNLGMLPNFVKTLEECRGNYVALLEGDDYWTSPAKLQKQVDFLDRHPECALCFHGAEVVYESGKSPHPYCRMKPQPAFTLEDLLASRCQIPTCAVMFRNHLFGAFPDWYFRLSMGDLPLHILNARHGDIGFLDETMAAYRVHVGGVWTGGSAASEWEAALLRKRVLATLQLHESLLSFLEPRHRPVLREKISLAHYELVWASRREGNLTGMRRHLWEGFKSKPLNRAAPLRLILKSVFLAFVPGAFRLYHIIKNRRRSSTA